MITEGYSGTPLAKKIGLKEGQVIRVINEPAPYLQFFQNVPAHLEFCTSRNKKKDIIHLFITNIMTLQKDITTLRGEIKSNGCLWVSWPKKSSGIASDVSEDGIRHLALQNGLVDVKVCAVDKIWSGLKLVIPLKLR